MKSLVAAAAAAAFIGAANAFPASFVDHMAENANAPRNAEPMPMGMRKRQDQGLNVPFDAKAQYISTTGEYAWVAPGPTDIRGPCPGLNAIANHGYLPHNGVATITQFIKGTTGVFGMGVDLSTFLAVYGAVFDGDLISWSIGGPPPAGLLDLSKVLGQPEGISGSHNKYEADVSPTRGDLFQIGNDYKIVESQWDALYATQAYETEETSDYNLGILTAFRGRRFNESISQNPYFFNAPFSGVIVQPAAYTFIYRFMANKSEEAPEGRLSQNVLKSFFGVSGEPGNWSIPFGYERIPDNWYTRNVVDQYSIPFFALDVFDAANTFPEFLNIGGNFGQVNTFAGVDVNNLTGGLYNAKTLGENNNAMCLVFELLLQALPDLVENLVVDTQAAVSQMEGPIKTALNALGSCPQLNSVQQNQFTEAFKAYPGYSQLKADGTYGSGASEPNGLLGIL